jgi:hypothetical protein
MPSLFERREFVTIVTYAHALLQTVNKAPRDDSW